MADLFDFDIQATPAGEVAFRILSTNFGDGYRQTAADGLNNKVQAWNVGAVGLWSSDCAGGVSIGDIVQFIDNQGGYKSFRWVPPGQTSELLFQCSGYSLAKDAGVFTITMKFVQSFQP